MLNVRTKQARAREWATQTRLSMTFETGLKGKLRMEFIKVSKLAKKQYQDSSHVDIQNDHERRLVAIMTPYAKASFKVFGARVQKLVEKKATDEEMDEFANEYIRQNVMYRMSNVAKTTAGRVSDAITEGRDAGLTQDEIADLIVEKTGGKIGESRAATIARTEMHAASQAGGVAVAESLDIPGLQKEWVSMGDARVRDDHAEVDGTVVPLDDTFTVGDDELDHPGDPSGSPEETINCRCVLTYTTEGT